MKTYKIFAIAMAAVATASCAKEIAQTNAPEENLNLSPLTLSACTGEEDTKAGFSGTAYPVIEWKANDAISILGTATGNQKFTTEAAGASVEFSGLANFEDETLYAVYPYDEALTLNGDGIIANASIPALQTAAAGSFDPKAYMAMAKCTDKTTLKFEAMVTFFKFKVADAANVKSVTIKGNNGENMACTATLDYEAKSHKSPYVDGTTSEFITLTGTFENGKEYFAIARPNKYLNGITVYVQYTDGTVKSGTTTNQVFTSGSRNHIKNLGTLAPTTEVNDLYMLYNMGLDIEIAGTTVNKAEYGPAKLVANAGTLSNGVNFIDPEIDGNVTFDNHAKLVAVGRYSGQRSKVSKSKYLYLPATDENDYFLLKNLEVTLTSDGAYLIAPNQNDKKFETIGFENCAINIPVDKSLVLASNNTRAIDKFDMIDCDVRFDVAETATETATERYILKCSNAKMSSVTFENNLFYSISKNKSNFAMLNNSAATVAKLAVNRNSIVNLYPKAASGYCITKDVTEASGSNNIFYIPDYETIVVDADNAVKYSGIVVETSHAPKNDPPYLAYIGYADNFKTNCAIYGDARPAKGKLKCGYESDEGTIYTKSKEESVSEGIMNYSPEHFDLANGVFKPVNPSYGAQRTLTGTQSLSERQTWNGVSAWN